MRGQKLVHKEIVVLRTSHNNTVSKAVRVLERRSANPKL